MSIHRPGTPTSRPAASRALAGLLLLPAVLALATLHPLQIARALAAARVILDGGRLLSSERTSLQETLWDCGPAALHDLLVALGAPSPGPAALAEMSGTSPRGTPLAGLVGAARSLGVPLRARRPSPDGLLAIRRPFLAWLTEGHYVTVVALDSREGLTIHDPGVGAYRLPVAAFRRRWGGVVADLEPGRTLSAIPDRSISSGILSPSDRR